MSDPNSHPIKLETVACPLCHSPATNNEPLEFDQYKVVQCSNCHLSYLSPRPTEEQSLRQYESDDYFGGTESGVGYGGSGYDRQQRSLRITYRSFLNRLTSSDLYAGGDLLEVGCGHGFFLAEASGHFSSLTGFELSEQAARLAADYCPNIVSSSLAELTPASFDCIVTLQVIEHVYNPVEFMEQLMILLRPGGSLILATPDYGGFWRRLQGRNWSSYKIPEHVVFYNKDTLSSLMLDSGLSQLTQIPFPHAFPLDLVLSKLSLPAPQALNHLNLWIPKTTLCIGGIKQPAPDTTEVNHA